MPARRAHPGDPEHQPTARPPGGAAAAAAPGGASGTGRAAEKRERLTTGER